MPADLALGPVIVNRTTTAERSSMALSPPRLRQSGAYRAGGPKRQRVQKGSQSFIYMAAGFTWGTAKAFRNFAGHIALSVGADVFIPDRLAPEHPFPPPFETSTRAIADCLIWE